MATHISQTTNALAINEATPAREVISYDPATGAEVGRAPLGSREDVNGAVARVFSRRGLDWTDKFPHIVTAACELRFWSETRILEARSDLSELRAGDLSHETYGQFRYPSRPLSISANCSY